MKLGDYQVGAWWIVTRELKLVRSDGQNELIEETLPPKVFEVLLKLVQSTDHTVTRTELIDEIWAGNVSVGTRGITNAIYALRKILDDGEQQSINTISKTGYQLLLPVSQPQQEPDAALPPVGIRTFLSVNQKASLFASIAALLLFAIYWQWNATPQRSQITRYSKPEPLSYLEGVEENPSVSPDGKFMAFIWVKDNEPARIFVKSLTDNNAPLRQLSFSDLNETAPAWSPDGDQIAYLRVNDTGGCEVWIKELRTLDEQKITTCIQERYHKALDWSPSGKFIAHIDVTDSGNTAVFLYELASGKKTQVSFPNQGERDNQLAWAHTTDKLAFVRALGTFTYDMYLMSFGEAAKRLTQDQVPIHGLTWDRDDKGIVFNSVRDGEHAYWRYLLANANIEFVHRDQTPFNIIALPAPMSYAYVKHGSQEQLVYIRNGHEHVIESTGRDLYGALSPKGEQLAFLSNRSGKFEIWVSDVLGKQAFQLTNTQGLPEMPNWAPDGHSIITVIDSTTEKPKVIQAFIASREQKTLLQDGFQYRNPVLNADGTSIVLSSNRSGDWQLWRYDIPSRQFSQLTQSGGQYGIYGNNQTLYYTRSNIAGLWQKTSDGKEKNLIPTLAADDWGSWIYDNDGIYYIKRDKEADKLIRWENDVETEIQSFAKGSIKIHRSLSVDKQQNMIVTKLGKRAANILTIAPVKD